MRNDSSATQSRNEAEAVKILGAMCLIVLLVAIGLGAIALAQYGYYFGPTWLCRDGDTPSPFLLAAPFCVILLCTIGVAIAGAHITE